MKSYALTGNFRCCLCLGLTVMYLFVVRSYGRHLGHHCDASPGGEQSGKTLCYKYLHFPTETKTYEQAERECYRRHGRLAMPKEPADREYIDKMVREKRWKTRGRFVALRKDGDEKHYHTRWEDGTRSADFLDESGSEMFNVTAAGSSEYLACFVIKGTQLWEAKCTSYQGYICEKCIESAIATSSSGLPSSAVCICENRIIRAGVCGSGCTKWTRPLYRADSNKFCDLLPCPSFRYGEGCKYQCLCKDFVTCNQHTGKCPADKCARYWEGSACNMTGCSYGYYRSSAERCFRICTCPNYQSCHPLNGICHLGCNRGMGDADCLVHTKVNKEDRPSILAPSSKCSPQCHMSSCAEDSLHCVYGCKDDLWMGPKCDKKSENLVPTYCDYRCKYNLCDPKTIGCAKGCTEGWGGPDCTQRRSTKRAVEADGNETESCSSHCKEDLCHPETFVCSKGCEDGWRGSACDIEVESMPTYVLVAILIATFVLSCALGFVVTWCICRYRGEPKSKSAPPANQGDEKEFYEEPLKKTESEWTTHTSEMYGSDVDMAPSELTSRSGAT